MTLMTTFFVATVLSNHSKKYLVGYRRSYSESATNPYWQWLDNDRYSVRVAQEGLKYPLFYALNT